MNEPNHHYDVKSHVDYLKIIYRRHFQGALVRSGASVIMWLFALATFLTSIITMSEFKGMTLSVVYLILINPPTLLLLKRITNMHTYRYASLLINFLEVLGYTAILYFVGGIEATFITLIYAALITYVGIVGSRKLPFIIAILCSVTFTLVVVAEHFGFIPHQGVLKSFESPWSIQLYRLSVIIALLFVIAYISSYASSLLKKNRDKLRQQNLDLMEKTASLSDAEQQLRTAHQDLEIRIKERTDELVKAEERLQRAEKMEALGTLAGGVAHDLNNVLGIVVGYSELLHDKIDESSPMKSYVMNIMQGGERAAAIVQDLLTLARRGIHAGKVINLNTTIIDFQKSPEFMNPSSFHPEVNIKTNLDSDLLNITGSPVHLSKTLMNLVSNAAEAMPNGGELVITTSNQYLDRPVQGYDDVRDGDYVVLSVSDTGEGIPAADLKRIFEPFYTKKVMGRRSGTGLGLAVVWGTVKDHNGYINVQSEEGKGSTFTLYFPVTREEISEDQIFVPVSEYMGNGESILVVDDIKSQCELATQMLGKLNYNVATVSSGEEAVEYVKKNRVDLIVLDMIMDPGIDGLDTYKRILEIQPKQKAIIVSGFSESERVHDAQVLGAGPYVIKPYVIEKLGLAVRKELDRK